MQTELSILIVNFRSKNHLRKCLETVRATCGDLAPQVVVVDGGSFDGCAEMLASDFPEVTFVQSMENVGFARSNNLGFSRVLGENVLLLNPDTELRPGSVQTLLRAIKEFPHAGLAGPRLLNTDGSLQTSCVQALPTPWNQAIDADALRRWFPRWQIWGTHDAFEARDPLAVQAVSGACMLLRSAVFKQVGLFTERFFMYAEDMDLCAKVRQAGLQVVHVPQSLVVHHGGASSSTQVSQFSTVQLRVAGELYMRLNRGSASALAYRTLQGVSASLRILALAPAALLLPAPAKRARARGSLTKWWYVLRWSLGGTS